MFTFRDRAPSQGRADQGAGVGSVDVAFTDRHGGVSGPPFDSLDLSRSRPDGDRELSENFALVAAAFGVSGFATMRQVHGADVREVDNIGPTTDPCDALVTRTPGVALCVRVGDCVPVVLADAGHGVVGVAHVGRPGMVAGVVAATVGAMCRLGASDIDAYVGPHICGACYEVPAVMRAEVSRSVPASFACTSWGSPSVDIGAGVAAQLRQAGCVVHDVAVCTRESADLYSYRRDGQGSGRSAGLAVLREPPDG